MPEDNKEEYRQAYETWTKHVQDLHAVLLDGQRLDPPQLKGLLNREARSKERYDMARRKLLGIED
jgi:hypothetical protein